MRTLLLGAASAAALLAPAVAHADTGGYVGLSVGQSSIDDFNIDLTDIGISGAGAVDVGSGWRAQFDGTVDRLNDGGDAVTLSNLEAHLYTESQGWAWGVVLSETDFGFANDYTLGLEGQATFGQFVLEGGAGFGSIEAFGSDANTTSADADLTWYAGDNFSLDAGVDYYDSDNAFGTLISYTLGGEYQFQGSSNSVFAGYTWTDYDDINVNGDTWRIGFRHAFGDDGLAARRQSGPRWLPKANNTALLGFGPSDRRLKRDIAWLGVLPNGINIYMFRYTWSDTAYVGVMAQELLAEPRFRHAVVRQPNGFYAVNYAKLGMRMTTLDRWQADGLQSVQWSPAVEERRAA